MWCYSQQITDTPNLPVLRLVMNKMLETCSSSLCWESDVQTSSSSLVPPDPGTLPENIRSWPQGPPESALPRSNGSSSSSPAMATQGPWSTGSHSTAGSVSRAKLEEAITTFQVLQTHSINVVKDGTSFFEDHMIKLNAAWLTPLRLFCFVFLIPTANRHHSSRLFFHA